MAEMTSMTDTAATIRFALVRSAPDGETYAVFVDDEPVLYRRISDIVPSAPRLRIEQGAVQLPAGWRPQLDMASLDAQTLALHRSGSQAGAITRT